MVGIPVSFLGWPIFRCEVLVSGSVFFNVAESSWGFQASAHLQIFHERVLGTTTWPQHVDFRTNHPRVENSCCFFLFVPKYFSRFRTKCLTTKWRLLSFYLCFQETIKYIFRYFRYCFNSLVAVRHGFPSRANPPASLILHPRFGYQPIHKGLLLTSDKELLEASPEKSLDHINVYI